MNLRSGHRLFLARDRQRASDFQAFVRLVHQHYRAWHVALLLDEDPSHIAKSSVALATELDMTLIWLPKRAPELNPIDTLWGQAKDVVSANKQYASLDEQVERFLAYLSAWSNREALTTAGVCPRLLAQRCVVKELLRTCLGSGPKPAVWIAGHGIPAAAF